MPVALSETLLAAPWPTARRWAVSLGRRLGSKRLRGGGALDGRPESLVPAHPSRSAGGSRLGWCCHRCGNRCGVLRLRPDGHCHSGGKNPDESDWCHNPSNPNRQRRSRLPDAGERANLNLPSKNGRDQTVVFAESATTITNRYRRPASGPMWRRSHVSRPDMARGLRSRTQRPATQNRHGRSASRDTPTRGPDMIISGRSAGGFQADRTVAQQVAAFVFRESPSAAQSRPGPRARSRSRARPRRVRAASCRRRPHRLATDAGGGLRRR